MAYVGNVADVLLRGLSLGSGIHIFNYVDTPDMNMNELVALVNQSLGRQGSTNWRIPLPLAMAGGHVLDGLARATGRTFPISAIRVRKFCESTQFRSDRLKSIQFKPSTSLQEALVKTIRSEFNNQ